jgi:2-oxoglutarate/2-oxoacid ferredoxin oxidoreductase subunit beta
MVITQERQQVTAKDFKSSQKSTWCPGCGDFGIQSALQTALINSGIAPWQVLLVSGIGCGSKLPDYINANGYMTLHGRGTTIACGAHLANPKLVTISIGGDGDSLGMGLGHAVHNMRRNMDIVQIIENNEVYGLTKGQYSPTSKRGFRTTTSPEGAIEFAVNPLAIGLAAGATFIGRGFSGDPKFTADIIQQALEHKGYALVEVLQTCPSYNKLQSTDWYKEYSYKVLEENANYNCQDPLQAFELALKDDGRYPMGILYKNDNRPTYIEQVPAYKESQTPIIERPLKIEAEFFANLKKSYI